ncbi:hypothetical protein LZ24_03243 [Desulfobotulus alkaliphilus]|uniref:Methyl-accepting chemotaxis protein n=1 Tax=Desulfobotulus alkaliphilus TaxID=622671 RepID=A0A562R2X7_9BACT|nr:hypothetical protein [Desulfobotulus alkaliphilus]TWI63407.1 hypothetical protein LZ24_03243 [Desulfobotulus alkaliphilus]
MILKMLKMLPQSPLGQIFLKIVVASILIVLTIGVFLSIENYIVFAKENPSPRTQMLQEISRGMDCLDREIHVTQKTNI